MLVYTPDKLKQQGCPELVPGQPLSILLSLIALLSSFSALAGPEIKTRNIYYSVSGATAEELWSDILKKSPVKHNGRVHVAYTKWHVDWRFWWRRHEDSCEITRVSTVLDVAYTMPRLEQNSVMPDTLLTRWKEYRSALFSHEQGHRDLGVQAAVEIEKTLSDMEPQQTCEQLERAANAMGKDVISKYSLIEKDYDRTTNHGLNTGAVFP